MASGGTIKVLGFSGSLRGARVQHLRAKVARACTRRLSIETFDLAPIPLYNEDVREKGFPPPVADFRAADQGRRCAPDLLPRVQLLDLGVARTPSTGRRGRPTSHSTASRSPFSPQAPPSPAAARSITCGKSSST